MLSPSLLYNLSLSTRRCSAQVSPSHISTSSIPIARSISLNRIISSMFNSHHHEPSFVVALRNYFAVSKRLVQEGDIITLCIDADVALDPHRVLTLKRYVCVHLSEELDATVIAPDALRGLKHLYWFTLLSASLSTTSNSILKTRPLPSILVASWM